MTMRQLIQALSRAVSRDGLLSGGREGDGAIHGRH